MAAPIRTCVACSRKGPKAEFIRVGSLDGRVEMQPQGRGAYLCIDAACIEKAFKRRLLARPLHVSAEATDWDALKKTILEKVNATNA